MHQTKRILVIASTMGALLVAGSANAQVQTKDEATEGAAEKRLAPATKAVELTVGTGYEQGFGKFGSGQPSLTDVGTAGGALQIGVGYRVIPRLTLGLYGSGAVFGRGDQVDPSANLYSTAAGFQADWHFLPGGHLLDPWISLGGGWRGYWIGANSGTTSIQGMEIAKLQVGVDYRIAQSISVSPVVGIDLSSFFTQSTPETNRFTNIPSPDVNTFLFAGMMGRFDLGLGSRNQQTASR
jgi:hypothetical protein